MRLDQEDVEKIIDELRKLTDRLPADCAGLTPFKKATRLRADVGAISDRLLRLAQNLDPIKQPDVIFDPSDPRVVGRFVALALLAQPRRPLSSIIKFYGSGIYALYYKGNFEPYQPIAGNEHPIYIGKADPAMSTAKTPTEQGDKLTSRINEHRKNIQKAEDHKQPTLQVKDFECRFLVVKSGLQTTAENYLIHLYKPIWNDQTRICYGLGKHGDAPETRANQRSPWDTLHPGRDWAHRDPKMKDAKTAEIIRMELNEHFKKYPPVKTINQVFKLFVDEMKQT